MRSRAVLLAAVMVAVALAGCEEGTPEGQGGGDPIKVGEPAPNFSLPAAGGDEVSLDDYRGQPVLLYFSMGPG